VADPKFHAHLHSSKQEVGVTLWAAVLPPWWILPVLAPLGDWLWGSSANRFASSPLPPPSWAQQPVQVEANPQLLTETGVGFVVLCLEYCRGILSTLFLCPFPKLSHPCLPSSITEAFIMSTNILGTYCVLFNAQKRPRPKQNAECSIQNVRCSSGWTI
jgi:hypothetical protein